MRFKITTEEAKSILEMHSKMKNNRPIIVEQEVAATEDLDITKLKSAIAAGCLTNGSLRKSQSTGKSYYRKASAKDPNKTVDFFADMTYSFTDGSASGNWKCDNIGQNSKEVPKLTPQQQKSVDDLINFYNKGPEPLYKKEEPTADQLAKKEWEKVNLKTEDKFKDIIFTDYFIWKKTGLRQTQSPQQKNIIKTYLNAGWQDIGGKLNPAEADKYISLDLMDDYPEDFKVSYKLVKPIQSIDIDVLIKELNQLVKTNNYRDRKTCRDIIEKYSVSKERKAYVDNAVLQNWKIAVKACITNNLNYNDLGITKGKIAKLQTPAVTPTTDSGTPDSSATPAKKDKWAL
jgi:hypothetical protein